MKKVLIFASLIAAGLSSLAHATDYVFVANDSSLETKMCIAAGSDNRSALRMRMTSDRANARYHANTIVCNGASLAQFAHQYGAQKTYNYLAPLTKNKYLYDEKVTIKDLTYAEPKGAHQTVYVMVSGQ
ncbi:DUF3718 domain-containing protein [Shewanella sedimentimangrovi]|uniref:DUF3718 domain-containing protein n=1 Tax=Shewanella sedimentimangrovi TaxID=2814293 RepID=A0ABX7QZX2_9GAMM|nr:DUF3718 domain-containing protein [Shewanella sedimentimangrovi]QSX36390.1 DUF3718 domain-containing protein [Shewanella sedimentimangrovi]